MENLVCLKKKIEDIIKKSSVPEDPMHSKNTLKWLLKLKTNADEALKIAALGHDIERAIEERKIKRSDYKTYDAFKDAHALNSAKIIVEIMKDCKINQESTDDVHFLVRHHECGGDNRINVLRDSDTISFFDVNLQFYFKRNDEKETKKRWLWGYNKLPSNLKNIVAEFNYRDKKLKSLVDTWIADDKRVYDAR